MLPVSVTYLKPRVKFLLIFLLFPIAMGVIYFSEEGEKQEVFIAVAIMSAVFLIIYFLLNKSYIMIDDHGITAKNVLREKSIDWKDIRRSYFKIIHTGKSSKRMWYFEGERSDLRFSSNLYSRQSLKTIAEALVGKCPGAEIDDKIRNIAEGKFPWYIF